MCRVSCNALSGSNCGLALVDWREAHEKGCSILSNFKRSDSNHERAVMRAIVIAPTEGKRHQRLVEEISSLESLEVEFLSALILGKLPDGYDQQLARALHHHDLLPGDVGCASSHLAAWTRVAKRSDPWTLIFEDDARIVDLNALDNFLADLNNLDSSTPTVISMYSENALVKTSNGSNFADCLMEPSFAVGYCLTRSAAEKLASTNASLGFCSDWPRASGVSFKLCKQFFVAHGDETTQSYVGNRNLNPVRRALLGGPLSWKAVVNRLEIYGFIHFFRYRSYFEGPLDYYRKVLRHRLLWHLARTAFRKKVLRPGVHVATLRKLV